MSGEISNQSPENNNQTSEVIKKALETIDKTEQLVAEQTGLDGEKLTEATDSLLTYIASETKKVADLNGVRTEIESANIREATEPIVVEGAIEQIGQKTTAGDNAIAVAVKSGLQPEMVETITELGSQNVTLPSGESVADIATDVLSQITEQNEAQEKKRFIEVKKGVYRIEEILTPEDIETINQMKNKTTIILDSTKGLTSETLGQINSETVFFSVKGGLDPEKKKKFDTEKYQARTMLSPKGLEKVVSYFERVEKDMDPNWTELQRAMYVYNCLVVDMDYDFENKKDNIETDFGDELNRGTILRSLNGVLYGKLTCAGFALTMKEMMDRVGVEAYYCNQKSKHGYNVICCDGKYYGIDVTWDNNNKEKINGKCSFAYFGTDKDFYSRNGHQNYKEEYDYNWYTDEETTRRIYDKDEDRFDLSTLPEDELKRNLSVIINIIDSRKNGSYSGFTKLPKEVRAKYLPIDIVKMKITNEANAEYENYMVAINCLRKVGAPDIDTELSSIIQPRSAYLSDTVDKYGRESSFGQDEITRLERIKSQEIRGGVIDKEEKQQLIDSLSTQLTEQIGNYLDSLLELMDDIITTYDPTPDMDSNRGFLQADLYAKMATVLNAKEYLIRKGHNESTIIRICDKITQKIDEKHPHQNLTEKELREYDLDYLNAVFSMNNLDVVKEEMEDITGVKLSAEEFRQRLSNPDDLLKTVYPNLLKEYHITKDDFVSLINNLTA